jgi:hypothetical protein
MRLLAVAAALENEFGGAQVGGWVAGWLLPAVLLL